MSNTNITIFFDSMGRTIIGKVVQTTQNTISIKGPAVLHAALNEEGKIRVNLIPAFFREFMKDWNSDVVFDYNKSSITPCSSSIELVEGLIKQYENMWEVRPSRDEVNKTIKATPVQLPTTEGAPVVDKLHLFDTLSS